MSAVLDRRRRSRLQPWHARRAACSHEHGLASSEASLRARYPDAYSADGGFYDAVDPTTGSVGHRRLVLDQSMIMAAIDDALDGGALQRYFAADRVSWAARAVLGAERMSIS